MRALLPVLSLLAVTMSSSLAAQDSVTMNDVTFRRHVQVEGHTLTLNGMALRKKAIFKVYVAGLYLAEPSSNAEQILLSDSPRRLVLQFLRDVDAKRMCDAWNDGLKDNTPNAPEALRVKFQTLCGYMEDLEKGEQFVFTYLPGEGTRVDVRGTRKGVIAGKDFADALFKSFIGPKPGPGDEFKRKLLGATNG